MCFIQHITFSGTYTSREMVKIANAFDRKLIIVLLNIGDADYCFTFVSASCEVVCWSGKYFTTQQLNDYLKYRL